MNCDYLHKSQESGVVEPETMMLQPGSWRRRSSGLPQQPWCAEACPSSAPSATTTTRTTYGASTSTGGEHAAAAVVAAASVVSSCASSSSSSSSSFATSTSSTNTSTTTRGGGKCKEDATNNSCPVVVDDSTRTAWRQDIIPRRYPLGTKIIKVVTKQRNNRKKAATPPVTRQIVGTIQGYRNDVVVDKEKSKAKTTYVSTGKTINWVVYNVDDNDDDDDDDFPPSEQLNDTQVADCQPWVPGEHCSWTDKTPRVHPIGTLVKVKFGEYFWGSVQGHRTTAQGTTFNWVVYEDGDSEEIDDKEMNAWLRQLRKRPKAESSTSSYNMNGAADSSRTSVRIKIEPDTSLQSDSSSGLQQELSPIKRETPDFTTSITEESDVSSRVAKSGFPSQSSSAQPDTAPSSSGGFKKAFLEEYDMESKVKVEGDKVNLTTATKERIDAVTKKWIAMNTDPKTGKGRYVFRKGCHEHCLTTVLGGGGCDAYPKSLQDREFIKNGDFYVAGNEQFNPYGPRFPGDPGFVVNYALEENPDQKEFHMFIECSKRPIGRLWQGKGARGGRLYVGVYRVSEDAIQTTMLYSELPEYSQRFIAKFYLKKNYFPNFPNGKPFLKEDEEEAKRIAGDEWDSMTEDDRYVASFSAYLIAINQKWELTDIEFVRYDEKLYEALVEEDAVAQEKGQKKRVSLDPVELGRFQVA